MDIWTQIATMINAFFIGWWLRHILAEKRTNLIIQSSPGWRVVITEQIDDVGGKVGTHINWERVS